MTNKKAVLWITVFMIIVASPSFTYFFLGRYLNDDNLENRNISSRPILTLENYDTFSEEFEEYYKDNIPYRNQLITLNNSIDYYLFHQSSSDKVMIGNNGWLFYCRKDDGNPLEQSLGYSKFSDEQLQNIAKNLESARRVLESQGIEFIFFIAPNKGTIYTDEVPEYYGVADSYTNTDQLIDYLRKNTNIRIVYPKSQLEEMKELHPDILLYRKLDTHWNSAGAYIGAAGLMNELGIQMPYLEDVCGEPAYLSGGDLTQMLNIKIKNGDLEYSIDMDQTGTPECEKADLSGEHIFHMPGADSRRLLVYRDSFSLAMMPFVASQFENSMFVHCGAFSQQQIFDYEADIFVVECVERYLSNLENFRISFLDYSIEEKEDEKLISIRPAMIHDGSQYISVFSKRDGTEEIISYQVAEPLDKEIEIQVPNSENGEIYVYVLKDKNGDELLEELTIPY